MRKIKYMLPKGKMRVGTDGFSVLSIKLMTPSRDINQGGQPRNKHKHITLTTQKVYIRLQRLVPSKLFVYINFDIAQN